MKNLDDLTALVREAVEAVGEGASPTVIVDHVLARCPEAADRPFNLATVMYRVLGLDIRDLHEINGWLRGELTRDSVDQHLAATQET